MKQILLFILSFASALFASAQQSNPDIFPYSKVTPQIDPKVKAILDNQVKNHAANKTTSLQHRLIAYSYYSFSGNQLFYDTMHSFYTNGRGSSFANCKENIDANSGSMNMKPDSIWVKNGSGNYLSYIKNTHTIIRTVSLFMRMSFIN